MRRGINISFLPSKVMISVRTNHTNNSAQGIAEKIFALFSFHRTRYLLAKSEGMLIYFILFDNFMVLHLPSYIPVGCYTFKIFF